MNAVAERTRQSAISSAKIGEAGIEVSSGAELWSLCNAISASGMAPKGMEKPETIMIALQMGMELGLPAMAALQNIAIINGRPSLWGDAQLAVCRRTGELEVFKEWYEQDGEILPRNPVKYDEGTVAVCKVKRKGSDEIEVGFSVADAIRAGLWGKAGPWTTYPFRMLKFRARSFALRDEFGDSLRGLLSAEEAMEIPTIDAVSTGKIGRQSLANLMEPADTPDIGSLDVEIAKPSDPKTKKPVKEKTPAKPEKPSDEPKATKKTEQPKQEAKPEEPKEAPKQEAEEEGRSPSMIQAEWYVEKMKTITQVGKMSSLKTSIEKDEILDEYDKADLIETIEERIAIVEAESGK